MLKKFGIGLVVFMILGGLLACSGGAPGDTGAGSAPPESVTEAPGGAPPASSEPAASAEPEKPKDENTRVPLAAGTTAQIEEGRNRIHGLTIVEVADPVLPTNEFDQPAQGHRYWGVNVAIESQGSDTIHTGAWKLRGSNDFEYDEAYAMIEPRLNAYTDLTAGGKAAGWVTFELPTDVQPKWLRYDPNMISEKDLFFDAQ